VVALLVVDVAAYGRDYVGADREGAIAALPFEKGAFGDVLGQ
jgi:hypothetical protein